MPTRPVHTLALALTVALTAACAPIAYRSTRPLAPVRDFDAVAVYPFNLEFQHQYHEAYGKTDNLLQALRQRIGDIPVIGPEEFTVIDPGAAPRDGSSLIWDARKLGFAPDRVAVLRTSARREEHNQRVLVKDFHGKPSGYLHAWWADYRVTIELVTLDGVVLARTVGEACEQRHDLAAAAAEEPYPKLREAIPLMLRDLYATAAPGVRLARRPVRTDIEVLDTHQRLLRHPEVALSLAGVGTVERDVGELVRYGYFHAALPAAWLPTLRQAGDGVVVLKVRGAAAGSGLRPGDVITAADGAPVRGPASFARALAHGTGALTVLRRSAPISVALAPACSNPTLATAIAAAAPGGRRLSTEPRGPVVARPPSRIAAHDARTGPDATTVPEHR
jgi:hypothetical protein